MREIKEAKGSKRVCGVGTMEIVPYAYSAAGLLLWH